MEIIHHYNGVYPFFLEHQTGLTYLQVLKEGLSDQQITVQKQKYKILKEIDHSNFVKLVKLYREDSTLHLLYEYFSESLERYVQNRSQIIKNVENPQFPQIYQQFTMSIDKIIAILIEGQIKTDISINNIAISHVGENRIKLFIDPEAQFLGLLSPIPKLSTEQMAKKYQKNKQFLHEFYVAQKKRLLMQYQQWLQKYFGKKLKAPQLNHPNFFIDGSKLVFINQDKQKQHKNSLIQPKLNEKINKNQVKKAIRNSPSKAQKQGNQAYKNLKQKNSKRVQQIKNVLNRLEGKTPHFNKQTNRQSPQKQYENINFPQNDIIIMKNQQKTPQKPVRFQNHYQHSNELEKIQSAKKLKDLRGNKLNKPLNKKQGESLEDLVNFDNQKTQKIEKYQQKKINHQIQLNRPKDNNQKDLKSSNPQKQFKINNVKIEEKPKNDSKFPQDDSTTSIATKTQKKQQKVNKYKMKIITSHQIEIQGKGQPQIKQIEKDIYEGIKSGKIKLNDLPETSKTVKVETKQSNQQLNQQKAEKVGSVDNLMRPGSRSSDITPNSKKMNEVLQIIQNKAQMNQNTSNGCINQQLHHQKKQHNSPVKNHTEGDVNNYYDKIREAKIKAQLVLKQYAKKKQ